MGFKETFVDFTKKIKFSGKAVSAVPGSFFAPEENALPDKLPVFPEWFFSARLGQPRQSNLQEIRVFAKSPWVQICTNTIKKEVNQIPYEIVLADEDDDTDDIANYQKEVDIIDNFLLSANSNNETINDLMNPIITDMGEIDAGAWVKVYSADSYTVENVQVEDEHGRILGEEVRLVLKEFGQRELLQLWYADGATFLKYIDIFRRLKGYYQYTFKNPRTSPIFFAPEEVIYFMLNRRSYTLYGFSPTQAAQQEIELMMQSTRYNKDRFLKNMIPDAIMTLEDADEESLEQAEGKWAEKVQNHPHKLLFINAKGNLQMMNQSNADMQWLEGQQWYFHIIFAAFGMSPAEVGFYQDVNRSSQEGQERTTVKTAIKPYLEMFEKKINNEIITELLQEEKPKIKFKFFPKDHAAEQIEFDQDMKELENQTITVNEFRRKRGREDVNWGDDPVPKNQSITFGGQQDQNNPNNPNAPDDKKKEGSKKAEANKPEKKTHELVPKNAESNSFYKKVFEKYLENKND